MNSSFLLISFLVFISVMCFNNYYWYYFVVAVLFSFFFNFLVVNTGCWLGNFLNYLLLSIYLLLQLVLHNKSIYFHFSPDIFQVLFHFFLHIKDVRIRYSILTHLWILPKYSVLNYLVLFSSHCGLRWCFAWF